MTDGCFNPWAVPTGSSVERPSAFVLTGAHTSLSAFESQRVCRLTMTTARARRGSSPGAGDTRYSSPRLRLTPARSEDRAARQIPGSLPRLASLSRSDHVHRELDEEDVAGMRGRLSQRAPIAAPCRPQDLPHELSRRRGSPRFFPFSFVRSCHCFFARPQGAGAHGDHLPFSLRAGRDRP